MKEYLCESIETMDADELVLLCEQVYFIKQSKMLPRGVVKKALPIEEVLRSTSSSSSSWSEAVLEGRTERV